tara:strand:+ start:845 stop:1435 length:591 start_codon:yes stop_codon:yes gene_type:complete
MCLKNKIIFVTVIFFFSEFVHGQDNSNNKIINYLENLKFFSASFIQEENGSLSNGKLFVGDDRIRVEYENPTKILIVFSSDKAMYYDYELDEIEFFDPKSTMAWFFYDIFNNPNFIKDSDKKISENYMFFEKNGSNEFGDYIVKIYFEDKPIVIRKIALISENLSLNISIFDHIYNEKFNKNFFKLINPTFFDEGK